METKQCNDNNNFSQIIWSDETRLQTKPVHERQPVYILDKVYMFSVENTHIFRPVRHQICFGFNVYSVAC